MSETLGQGTGPLRGVKVVEIAGIGPGPHACMILADLGADVIRVERAGGDLLGAGRYDVLTRGRPSVALDLKQPDAVATVLDEVEDADVLVEGMRPGAMEAGLVDVLFWGSLAFSLVVAFVVTVPVNKWVMGRGKGHAVVHQMHHTHH